MTYSINWSPQFSAYEEYTVLNISGRILDKNVIYLNKKTLSSATHFWEQISCLTCFVDLPFQICGEK